MRRRPRGEPTGLYSDRILNQQQRYRDRDRDRDHRERDRDRGGRDRDAYRRRDRSLDRRDDYRRDDRDRDPRRSRDRYRDGPRSPNRRPDRRRDDSRDRAHGRREGTADSHGRGKRDERTPMGENGKPAGSEVCSGSKCDASEADLEIARQTPKPAEVKPEAEKKAERLAKLEAWKKKREEAAQKQKDVNPSQTRNLLAEMDKKATGASPSAASPATPTIASPLDKDVSGNTSPAHSYAGKFDPKAIAKKSAGRSHDSAQVLGSGVQPEMIAPSVKAGTIKSGITGKYSELIKIDTADIVSAASALPANRAKASGFGFGKSQADDKLPSKRKLDLDEEETTKRKLKKLPTLPVETDDTPYAVQDDDDEDSDGDNFAETEEEAAAAVRRKAARAKKAASNVPQQSNPLAARPTASTKDSKPFNLETYKIHALGDYADHIERFGPTDCFTTQNVSCPLSR